MPDYITVDCGTTNTRVSLVKEGKVVDTLKFNIGAGSSENKNRLKQALKDAFGEILHKNNTDANDIEAIIACGMITGENGFTNLPHILAPAGIKELNASMYKTKLSQISDIPFYFIRGIKTDAPQLTDADMLRGEESELAGIFNGKGVYILPGSHSKIIKTDESGKILSFKTMLTGEMIASLSQNTILKNSVDITTSELDKEYLLKGYEFCKTNGVNEALFKVRLLDKLFEGSKEQVYSFFMGVVLCDEINYILSLNASRLIISGQEQIKNAEVMLLEALSKAEIINISKIHSERATAVGMVKIYEYNKEVNKMKILSSQNPKILFRDREIFVDHSLKQRSGHLGHAMAELKDGSIIAFYSNCSGLSGIEFGGAGHSMYGWVEYKYSYDRGITWTEPERLEYSYDCFFDGVYKIGCEKAVVCDDGTLVVFCLRSIGKWFEPYATPVYLISRDNGKTFSEPIELCSERGRIYDAVYRDGRIYVLEFCNSTDKGFTCNEEGKFYKIYASDDNGSSFYEYSTLDFNTMGHAYGNLIFREDNSLVFYAYNVNDEYHLTSLISEDNGKTWSKPFKIAVNKIARNPQVGYLNGRYIMHARSENGKNFVVYHSEDGINWDDGTIVSDLLDGKEISGYYSNNLVVEGKDGIKRMLVQYSEQYTTDSARVNIMHAWIECEP